MGNTETRSPPEQDVHNSGPESESDRIPMKESPV